MQRIPLAERMRPTNISNYIGQDHLMAENGPLRNALNAGILPSIILWGPPGVGKTTLAQLIADHLKKPIYNLSAINSVGNIQKYLKTNVQLKKIGNRNKTSRIRKSTLACHLVCSKLDKVCQKVFFLHLIPPPRIYRPIKDRVECMQREVEDNILIHPTRTLDLKYYLFCI